ncbi:hypothetical protein GCM10027287_48420 [Bordetella muralis]
MVIGSDVSATSCNICMNFENAAVPATWAVGGDATDVEAGMAINDGESKHGEVWAATQGDAHTVCVLYGARQTKPNTRNA